jgi:hypothetical protein
MFTFEKPGRDAQTEALEKEGDVPVDVGADPELLASERNGVRAEPPDVTSFAILSVVAVDSPGRRNQTAERTR